MNERATVYAAQEEAVLEFYELTGAELPSLPAEDVGGFLISALNGAGWSAERPPEVAYDVPDDDELGGWVTDGVIHVHSLLTTPWTLLHELAHWVDPRYGHGPRFCANFLGLVQAGLGDEACALLRAAFDRNDVLVDEAWAPSFGQADLT